MSKPKIRPMSYPPNRLRDWRRKDCRLLSSSQACDYLKEILADKVARRDGGRRFFGEAYVATQIQHQTGYYGSFKWLTNARFSDDRPFPNGPTKRFQEDLRRALLEHFGRRQLEMLRKRANAVHKATGLRPVAPDLWLIDREGNHRFIEVKLPGDRIRPQQLTGLDLIKSCLHAKTQVSVEIVELKPDDE